MNFEIFDFFRILAQDGLNNPVDIDNQLFIDYFFVWADFLSRLTNIILCFSYHTYK